MDAPLRLVHVRRGCLHFLVAFAFGKGALIFAIIIGCSIGIITVPVFLILLARSLAGLSTNTLTQALHPTGPGPMARSGSFSGGGYGTQPGGDTLTNL